ncbi:MAG: hypothetical protein EZS28_017667 [Streblomastix strix]|uniref:Uncharacterized protein n=1 Tax=Streblomastix strix TaxID=222440 RepID=A0A5J4VW56_9EUKA|nr:MAG: hypothetical protein EZS28_017667 [Streblomastix strix]
MILQAIDAQASSIDITVKKCGQDLIRIKDNGIGMGKDDIAKACLRHFTSKIEKFEDIQECNMLEMFGQVHEKETRKLVSVHIMDITGLLKIGTVIEVKNLFGSYPVRRGYLIEHSISVSADIHTIVAHYAVNFPKMKFSLNMDQNIVLSKPIMESMIDSTTAVFGISVSKHLRQISFPAGHQSSSSSYQDSPSLFSTPPFPISFDGCFPTLEAPVSICFRSNPDRIFIQINGR